MSKNDLPQPVSTNPQIRKLQLKKDALDRQSAALAEAIRLLKEADGILAENT